MPLIMAVVACTHASAQTDHQTSTASRGPSGMAPLTREDSLVLAEAGGPMIRTDSAAFVDSAARADSILRTRVRVVAFPSAIDSVLRDFPYNLRHITGTISTKRTGNISSCIAS